MPGLNPTQDNSNPTTTGSEPGTTQPGEELSLATAMGYDLGGSKPTEGSEPASADTSKPTEGSDTQKTEPTKSPTWFDQLSDDIKGDEKSVKTLSKFNSVGDLAKSYTELQKLMGSRIELPKDDADAEALKLFWQKVGMPKTADEYSIDGGDDVKSYKEMAYAANLTDRQAKEIFAALQSKTREVLENQKAELKNKYQDVDNALREKYGNQYGNKKLMLDKGIKSWGGEEVAKVLIESGAMFSVPVAEMLIRMGESASESGSTNMAASGRKDNYVSRRDGGGFNVNL